MAQKTNVWLTVACVVLAAAIFVVDVALFPLGVAGGVPYIAVVLISLWLCRRQHVLYAAIAVSALTILGYFWSEPAGIPWMVLANRFLALFAIWVTAMVGYQRKQSEEALRESEDQLRAILDTAADAIVTIDQRGIMTRVNPATEQMFGYTQEELVGQNVKILMPASYRNEHDGHIARYLETGATRIIGSGREVAGKRKDGSTFPVDLAVSEIDHLGLFTGHHPRCHSTKRGPGRAPAPARACGKHDLHGSEYRPGARHERTDSAIQSVHGRIDRLAVRRSQGQELV